MVWGLVLCGVLGMAAEDVQLSEALTEAAQHNLDLAVSDADVEIAEADVLSALGAYDVFLTGNLRGTTRKRRSVGRS